MNAPAPPPDSAFGSSVGLWGSVLVGAIAGAVWARLELDGADVVRPWLHAKMAERAIFGALAAGYLARIVVTPGKRWRIAAAGLAWLFAASLLSLAVFSYRDMVRRNDYSALLAATADFRTEIERRAMQSHSLANAGTEITVRGREPVSSVTIDAGGRIRVRGTVEGYEVEIGMSPALARDGRVSWSCGLIRGPGAWWDDGGFRHLPPKCRERLRWP